MNYHTINPRIAISISHISRSGSMYFQIYIPRQLNSFIAVRYSETFPSEFSQFSRLLVLPSQTIPCCHISIPWTGSFPSCKSHKTIIRVQMSSWDRSSAQGERWCHLLPGCHWTWNRQFQTFGCMTCHHCVSNHRGRQSACTCQGQHKGNTYKGIRNT